MESRENARNDPLVGIQERTDSPAEAAGTSPREVAMSEPPHGRAVKSRAVAGWLGVLLGGLGLHRFYLGYTKIGTVQLAAYVGLIVLVMAVGLAMGQSWWHTALTAISVASLVHAWGLIEGVMVLIGALDRDAAGRPLVR